MRRIKLPITNELENIRVGTLLRSQLGLSGTVIRRIKWFNDGILVDGVRVTTRYVPHVGQTISVRLSEEERRSGILPVQGALNIVFEDDDIIVLNKYAGVSVHPGPGHFDDTMGNFLLHYYDETGNRGDFHPVHRLDRGTSGLIVVAKHPHAQEVLKNQLHTPDFGRHYLAICEGHPSPSSGTIDAPLRASSESSLRRIVHPDGQSAVTHYETQLQTDEFSLIALTLETGRTHQIRAHMSHIGHPLVGDFLYGTENQTLITRPALHSHHLVLRHPITKIQMQFDAPLPDDMRALLPKQTTYAHS